jgi:hypothetical protein
LAWLAEAHKEWGDVLLIDQMYDFLLVLVLEECDSLRAHAQQLVLQE